jgi:hypothetical protein
MSAEENILSGTLKINIKKGALAPLSAKERSEDMLQLYDLLSENYPYFSLKKKRFKYDWLEHKEEFIQWAENRSCNEEFYLAVKRVITLLQNNHTELLNPLYREYLAGVYEGDNCWSRVLSHKDVVEKYEGWSEMGLPNPYVFPGEFKYFQGEYFYWGKGLKDEDRIQELEEGSVLVKVSGRHIDKYVLSLMDSRYLHYDFRADKPMTESLRIFANDMKDITLGLKGKDGRQFSRRLRSYKYYPRRRKDADGNGEGNLNIETLQENKTVYIGIKSFASRHIKPDRIVLEELFHKVKNYENIIIDVRGNGGGNEEYYLENIFPYLVEKKITVDFLLLFRHGKYIKPFLKDRGFKHLLKSGELKLTEELPANLALEDEYRKGFGFFINNRRNAAGSKYTGYKGKLYILTNHHTYSAAETFAAFGKASGIATIVGTTTGGDGVNLDPCVAALKNSGLVIRFNMSMGLNPDGSINEDVHTTPDIYVEQSFEDFIRGRDTLLEYMINNII